MENSRLIIILKTLSTEEMKEFGKFLNSVYTEKSSTQILYKYLKKIHPLFPSEKIDKGYVEKKLFKKTNGSERRLFDTKYMLLKTLKDFIIKKQLENSQTTRDLIFLEALKTRRLDNLFFPEIENVEKKWEENKIPGIEHLYEKYKLKAMYATHPQSSILDRKAMTPTEIMESLDKYYIAKKLYWTLCSLINQDFTNNKNKREKYFIEEVLKYASLPIFQKVPQIKLFRDLTMMIQSKNVENYEEVKQIFFNQFLSYNKDEQDDVISFFVWCCSYIGAYQELFAIKKFAVENKIILEDGYITTAEFIKNVNLGCKINEIIWTDNFIKNYGKYLEKKEKENTILFCEATIAITKKQFELALSKLSQIKFDNVFFGVQARCMILQCYYELDGYGESFEALINSTKTFLRRKEFVADSMKEIVMEFIFYIEKIEKIRRDIPYKKIKKQTIGDLQKKLEKAQNIMFRNWLIQKIEALNIK